MPVVSKVVFKSLDKNLRASYNDENVDVEFVLVDNNETKIIRAHEKYLSWVSIVFDNMFFEETTRESNTLTIKINEYKFDVFNAFIKYLYGDQIVINIANYTALKELGNKYKIADIVESCEAYKKSRFSVKCRLDQLYDPLIPEFVEYKKMCARIIEMTSIAARDSF